MENANYIKAIKHLIELMHETFHVTPRLGIEFEFYLISKTNHESNISGAISALQENGFRIERERGWNQFEWASDVYSDPCECIDELNRLKGIIIHVARSFDSKHNFDAKPFPQDYGSALQVSISLIDEYGFNIFCAEKYGENEDIAHVVAGLLDIAAPSLALLCKDEKDYERFRSTDFMAPTSISWGINNRTALIRVPHVDDRKHSRIEFRLAHANTNPYALFFIVLYGTYLGLKAKKIPTEPVYGNAFDPQYNQESLPKTLREAENLLAKSGQHIIHFLSTDIAKRT